MHTNKNKNKKGGGEREGERERQTRRKIIREEKKEGNVLFNNALNTFYLLLYCVR